MNMPYSALSCKVSGEMRCRARPAADHGAMAIKVPPAAGVRAEWPDLPAGVRAGIEDLLGAPVVAAVNQAGGFSPGLAARVRCADGSRAFVNQPGPNAGVAVPRLRATYDDGRWVALVLDEIDGHSPPMPWSADDLARVVGAITALSTSITPCPRAWRR